IVMDAEHVRAATTTVNLVSGVGAVCNALALVTIYKKKALHNSFGLICLAIALNNFTMISINTIWYSMPNYPIFATDSNLNRIVGYIGITLWIFSCRTHFLISLNRFIATVFPIYSRVAQTESRTLGMLIILLIFSMLQNVPYLVLDDVYFTYDRSAMFWNFAQTERGKMY
ncbi:hypothetical protein PFISCL1PPCAC_13907, partial [Pristionchus fissidentatus]